MAKAKKVASSAKKKPIDLVTSNYDSLIRTIRSLVETARHSAARSVNALMTATYWQISRRIVEFEQGVRERAIYGAMLLSKLSEDLSERLGRGFSRDNLVSMRLFYLAFPPASDFRDTVSEISGISSSFTITKIRDNVSDIRPGCDC